MIKISLNNASLGVAVLLLLTVATTGCGRTYQTQQPPVERSMIQPSTVPTDLTDTRAPYSVDEPVAPRPTPTPVPTPLPTPKSRTY